jgi:hypothetical protein
MRATCRPLTGRDVRLRAEFAYAFAALVALSHVAQLGPRLREASEEVCSRMDGQEERWTIGQAENRPGEQEVTDKNAAYSELGNMRSPTLTPPHLFTCSLQSSPPQPCPRTAPTALVE